jgi:putative hemolysin
MGLLEESANSAMPNVTIEILVVLLLLLCNGFLALSEIAVVSARRPRLAQRAARGDASARAALSLAESPTRFLSTVQVGITLIGILSGAYGGATIADKLATVLNGYPSIALYSEAVAVGIVVVILSYVSVIVGELVPKRIALSNPERFAVLVARPMIWLSRLGAPAVAALEHTSNVIMKVFRLPHGGDSAVTEADVAAMVAAGTAAGVFDPVERRIVERAFRLDEPVAAIMTPRTEIVWIDVNDPTEAQHVLIRQHPYSRFPVCDASLDRILGLLYVRDLWIAQRDASTQGPMDLRSLLRQPLFVPERSPTLDVLEQFQTTGTHVAIIIDEHGGVDGLLTLNNILTFLVAPPASASSRQDEPAIVQRTPDSWLVDGALSLGDFYSGIGVEDPEADQPRAYHTVAGLVMTVLGGMPAVGDRVEVGLLSLEVVDMDGFRVDKVLVTRTPPRSMTVTRSAQ